MQNIVGRQSRWVEEPLLAKLGSCKNDKKTSFVGNDLDMTGEW